MSIKPKRPEQPNVLTPPSKDSPEWEDWAEVHPLHKAVVGDRPGKAVMVQRVAEAVRWISTCRWSLRSAGFCSDVDDRGPCREPGTHGGREAQWRPQQDLRSQLHAPERRW